MVDLSFTPCIPFEGARRNGGAGYGYLQFQGQQYLAHRLAYALNNYLRPEALKGVVVRHKCDNPACINVDHLEPGTVADNMADKVARNRQHRGEQIVQAKLTGEQVQQIRAEYVPRSRHANQRELAKKYGVSQATISLILAGQNWSHLK